MQTAALISAPPPTALAVIAGGAGARMGGPKHGLRIAGVPILRDLLARLQWRGPKVLVLGAGQAPPLGAAGFDLLTQDELPGAGPVAGIWSALRALEKAGGLPRQRVVCVPVDMPRLGAVHVRWLAAEARARPAALGVLLTLSGAEGRPAAAPFPCVFALACAAAIGVFLSAGQRAMHQLAGLPGVVTVPAPATWEERVWTNLNTPAELDEFLAQPTSDHRGARP